VIITIGGLGERMKQISPVDKHLLYYKDKRIIDWIFSVFPSAKLIGLNKTKSRKETLMEIKHLTDVLIIDCDVIPLGFEQIAFSKSKDAIFYFESSKNKYSSLIMNDFTLTDVSENKNISKFKSSGVYYIKKMSKLLERMEDNSVASGMIGCKCHKESTFIRLGDIEDYFEAL